MIVFKGEHYQLSNYAHIYKKEENVAIWHSLNMQKVYGDSILNEFLQSCSSGYNADTGLNSDYNEIVKTLISRGFIVKKDSSKDHDRIHSLKKLADPINIKNLVLLVSNNCNLACTYCQIEENISSHEHKIDMTKETAKKAIDLFYKNAVADTKKTITITGGEPLLNLEITKYIIQEARKQDPNNTRIVIFTNGYFLEKETAEYFKNNNVLVLISIDGPKHMHDLVRKDKLNQGSFDKVVEGYELLKEIGCNVGISAVGGTHNIGGIDETLQFFRGLKPSSLGFNFSHFLLDKDNPTEINIDEFGKILLMFYEVLRKDGIFLENISRPIQAFTDNNPKVSECQAHGKGFTVDARGKIGPCKSLLVSDIYSTDLDTIEEISSNELFKQWTGRSPLLEEECRLCPAITICGGGCAYDSYISNNGDFKKMDKRICNYHLMIIEYLIWELHRAIEDETNKRHLYEPSREVQEMVFNRYYKKNNELQKSVGHSID